MHTHTHTHTRLSPAGRARKPLLKPSCQILPRSLPRDFIAVLCRTFPPPLSRPHTHTHTPTHSRKHTNMYANTRSETHAHTLGAASVQASYPLACIVFELKSCISFSGTRISFRIDKVLIFHARLDVFTAAATSGAEVRLEAASPASLRSAQIDFLCQVRVGVDMCAFLFTFVCAFVCLCMLKVSFPTAPMDVCWEHAGVILHTDM